MKTLAQHRRYLIRLSGQQKALPALCRANAERIIRRRPLSPPDKPKTETASRQPEKVSARRGKAPTQQPSPHVLPSARRGAAVAAWAGRRPPAARREMSATYVAARRSRPTRYGRARDSVVRACFRGMCRRD